MVALKLKIGFGHYYTRIDRIRTHKKWLTSPVTTFSRTEVNAADKIHIELPGAGSAVWPDPDRYYSL